MFPADHAVIRGSDSMEKGGHAHKLLIILLSTI